MNNHPHLAPLIEVKLPKEASAEALFVLVEVLEQIVAQVFDHPDPEIAEEVIRRFNATGVPKDYADLGDGDLPF